MERGDADYGVHVPFDGKWLREVGMDDLDPVEPVGQPGLALLEHGPRSIHGHDSHARNQLEQNLLTAVASSSPCVRTEVADVDRPGAPGLHRAGSPANALALE